MMPSVEIAIEESWRGAHPGAAVGLLVLNGLTCERGGAAALTEECTALEQRLRERFGGRTRPVIAATPPLPAYTAYYRRWKKTYHVLQQLESVAQKGRSIPRVTHVVQAAFMAELESLLLTATHDLDAVHEPLRLFAASGSEAYTLLSGVEATLKPGDMAMADGEGVICSVLAGQDRRTRVTDGTCRALLVVYTPPGVPRDAIDAHLDLLERYIRLAAPAATVEQRTTTTAG